MTEITQTTVSGNSVYIIDDVNNTLVVDSTRARVGIGTTNPGYALAVSGDIHGTGLVQGVNLTLTAGAGGVLTFADGTTQATAATATATIGGTIANTQVAFGTAGDTIGGDANFTYVTGTGTLLIGAANAGFLTVGTGADPTGSRAVEFQTSTASNNIALFKNTGGTSSVIQFEDTGTANAPIIGSNGNDLILETQNAAGTIKFETAASVLSLELQATGNMRMLKKLSEYNDVVPADGQLLIGDNAGGVWDAATLTAGSNISITNGAGAITIAATGGGTMSDWIMRGDATNTATVNNGEIVQFTGGTGISTLVSVPETVTFTLDDTAVTAASYGSATQVATFTVDAQGRLTAAANQAISFPSETFTLTADSGSNQTIGNGDTMDIAGGTGIDTVVGATDTVTVSTDTTVVRAPTPVVINSIPYFDGVAASTQNGLPLADGQLLIGSTAAVPVAATLTAGGGISITNAAGSITIANTGGSMTSWTLTGDSGSNQTVEDGQTVDIAGGTGISTVVGATDTVTINLDNTAVTPATYGSATEVGQFTVDAQGRITGATSVGISQPSGANPSATVSGSAVNGSATTFMRSDAAPALANTTVTAGSYTRASLTVDAQGRLTAASSGSAPDISGTIAAGQVAYGASADTIEGDNNLFWDTTNDRLGIGTNAPASSLHIIGIDDDNPEVRLQRTGVATQYLSMQNEDASGSFINSESAESNKKALYMQSVHNSGGSAGGDNLIIWRTGAASGPTERMRISDVNNLFTVQSTMDMNVESKLAVGKTSAPSYTLEVEGSNSQTSGFAELTGGLFSSSSGDSSLTNGMPGWWLTAKGMNTTSKYTPALKFGSTDPDFTTTNPKWTAGIIGEAIETYAADDKGGMDMHFLTAPAGVGVATVPTINMTLTAGGKLGIGTQDPSQLLHISGGGTNNLALFESTDATARISFRDNSTSSVSHVGIGASGNDAVLFAGNATVLSAKNSGNVQFNAGKFSQYNGASPSDGQLLIGDAAGGVWDAATLTAGSNITITNAAGAITIAASGGGGGGTPAGANTQIQFNNAGAFGASAQLTFDGTTLGCGQNITAGGKLLGNDLNSNITGGGYALITTANHVWPGAVVGSSPVVMPAIDLSAGSYDFATLGGAGQCSETHYLMVVNGDPGGANSIQMPDPSAVGLPPGGRWTISFNDGSGQQQFVDFPAVPLNGAFAQIEARAIGAVTIFTDGQGWFVESLVDTSGSGRIVFS